MYPFTEQLMEYNSKNINDKIGMLILDVKGNYNTQVKQYAKKYKLEKDLVIIELKSKITYNPLDKPNLKPAILANRLKTILELFSENNSESYWLDKAEQILAEAIKICRIYNNGYVTFKEIHKLITIPNYYKEKIQKLKNLFILGKLNNEQIYELNTALDFFQKEFESLDQRTSSILKSEITRITNTFISDYNVYKTFCPEKEEKEKISKNISENAKNTHYSLFTNSLVNRDSNISESLNIYTQNDYIFDSNFFTQELETFNALCFLSDGKKILKPIKLKMYPYFIKESEEE